MDPSKSATYRQAGVDIDAGERAVDLIKEITRSTFTPNVLSDIGGFSGLFSLSGLGYRDPVLVSGTDGVGTKLKIAFLTGRHDTVGIDAVAMCANDVICTGARPLFFLDYIAVGQLEPEKVRDVISGIGEGCRQAGAALIGGEMAEMPGFYSDGEYDIAGFCVGIAEREGIIDGSAITAGDVLIGLPSSGVHSNGFSLVRSALFDLRGYSVNDSFDELGGATLGEALLTPTKIYAREVNALAPDGLVKGISHITGGGLEGNTMRIIPAGLSLDIDWTAWQRLPIFDFIQKSGNIAEEEMRRVFNCGIGMVFATAPDKASEVISVLTGLDAAPVIIGKVK